MASQSTEIKPSPKNNPPPVGSVQEIIQKQQELRQIRADSFSCLIKFVVNISIRR